MKILFVGLGSIGQRHLSNLISLGYDKFYALRNRGNALPLEISSSGLIVLKDWEEVALVRPDFCILAAPPVVQQEYLPLIVAMGMDVFVEKPIGTNLNVLFEVLETVKEKKLVSMVGYNLRYHPLVARLKEILCNGYIGNQTSFRLEVGQYLPDWHPYEDYRAGYSAQNSLGGGVTLDLIHEIDLAYYLFGTITDVKSFTAKRSHLEIDVEDTSEIIVKLQNGVIGSIHLDYVNRIGMRKGTIIGDCGVLDYDLLKSEYNLSIGKHEKVSGKIDFQRNDMYKNELIEFLQCVENRTEPKNNLESGLAVLEYALKAKG